MLTLYIATIIHVPLNRRCWARKKSDCLPCDEHTYIHTDFRKISRRRVYFPSPIFPHPSPCRHSHFPIWWTIKRLLQQFFLSKLHSTLPRFLFENSIKEKKIASSSLEFCFEKKKDLCLPPKKMFSIQGAFSLLIFKKKL